MITKQFSVHDSAAQAYLLPIYAQSTGVALRSFAEAANREGHNFNRHAADYTLFETGAFDDSTGLTTNLPNRVNLGCALDFIDPAPFQGPPPTGDLGAVARSTTKALRKANK